MRFFLLSLAFLFSNLSQAQIKLGDLKYNGIGSHVMTAFHSLNDGNMIANFRFHGEHKFCDERMYGGSKTALVKFDRDGNIKWQKCYTKYGKKIVKIMPYDGNNLACLGYSYQEVPGKERKMRFWILIIDSDGNEVKDMVVEGTESSQESVWCASVTPDGGFIAGGSINVLSDYPGESLENDIRISKVDKNGVLQWQRQIDKAFWERISSIVTSKNGGYIAAGWIQFKGEKEQKHAGTAWVFKLDEKGEIEWEKNYGSGHYDYVSGLIENDNGDIVFIGRETGRGQTRHNSCGSQGFWITGLNNRGHIKWENFMVNRSIGSGSYSQTEALVALENGGYLVGGADVSDFGATKVWLAEFGPEGKLLYEQFAGELVCHGVSYLVPTSNGFLAAGWNQGYNTFKDGKLGMNIFDTWTLEVSLEEKQVPSIVATVKPDSSVSQTIAFQEQKEGNAPHLFVQVHQPDAYKIHVYPNPAYELINLDLNQVKKKVSVQVFDLKGKLQFEWQATNQQVLELNIGHLKAGVYLINVLADGRPDMLRFVKE